MNNKELLVILILGIWLLCAIVSAISRDADAMVLALIATGLIGLGYMLLH